MYVIYVMERVHKQPQLTHCTAVLFQHSAVTSAPPPRPPTLASDEGSLYLLHSLDWQAHLMTIKRREQLGSFNTLNNIPHQLTYMRDGSDIWEQTIQEF